MIEPFVVQGYEPQTFYQPKREKIMKDKNIENELHPTLSKLTKQQFAQLRNILNCAWYIDVEGFYPNLNLELLTKCMEGVDVSKNRVRNGEGKLSVDLTDEEFISIIKEYGSVSHSISVSGCVTHYQDFVTEYEIPAEKIKELGVDKIQSWGDGDFVEGFENISENCDCDFDMDEEIDNLMDCPEVESQVFEEIKVITSVKVVLPTPDVFAEKEVIL